MIVLFVVWLVFVALFGYLGFRHWGLRHKDIPYVQMPEYGEPGTGGFQTDITAGDVNQLVKDWVGRFNEYVDGYNRASKQSNTIQAIGYWAASFTAVISAVVTLSPLWGWRA